MASKPNRMKAVAVVLLLLIAPLLYSQQPLRGLVADSLSRQLLPFATVQASSGKTVIAGIDGRFSLAVKEGETVRFSYGGHKSKTIPVVELLSVDTILLSPSTAALDEVIIRSPSDKIARIVNAAIRAKPRHNPDQYAAYQCNVYYKMIVDIAAYGNYNMDSIERREDSIRAAHQPKRKKEKADTVKRDTAAFPPLAYPSHLFMTETYSKRQYKKPAQTQEIILASKASGLSKTYFANIITDVLPFHVYGDYINLNGTDFINPLAKGWQSRYRFFLEDEIAREADTVFILAYRPKKGASFNSLTGLLYISSNGYAVTHFTGINSGADSAKRFIKFEHIYRLVADRWFPQELNYDFGIRGTPTPYSQVVLNGHSVIDSVAFDEKPPYKFDKAHPVKFGDSIDLQPDRNWARFRRDTLTLPEQNTYRNMDSLRMHTPMEKFIVLGTRVAMGRFPIGKVDVDLKRLLAVNRYEGTRLGLGLYTNNKLSKYWSVGGWWGYGFRDKAAKYGGSLTLFPTGGKENWLAVSYRKDYRLTGEVALHPELAKAAFSNWLLQQVDEIKEWTVSANFKPGYWELRPFFSHTDIGPLHYSFESGGKAINAFTTTEAGLGMRYAYGEKRAPFFDSYLSQGTKYPVLYASLSAGRAKAEGYDVAYRRALAAVRFSKHFNRWGADRFRLEGGWLQTEEGKAVPRSVLMAGNGYRRSGINFYLPDGFITIRPFDFYADRYVSFFYKHDFDKNFWSGKWSKPYLSLAHNLVYGSLQAASKRANAGISSYDGGYHESGILLNRLLKYDFGFSDAGLNVGAFYHWQKGGTWQSNGVWVVGVSLGF